MATTISPRIFLDLFGIFIDFIKDGMKLTSINSKKLDSDYQDFMDSFTFELKFTAIPTCTNCDPRQLFNSIKQMLEKDKFQDSEYSDYQYRLSAKINNHKVINDNDDNNAVINIIGVAKLQPKNK